MRTYYLYLIEDEFAKHYFGREKMFYNLFAEYRQTNNSMKKILEKQILYITKPISTLKLHKMLYQKLSKRNDFHVEGTTYYIEMNTFSAAKLEIFDRFLILQSSGTYDAETIFFETLRKNEWSYLAIDLDHHRYGWLKPIKERKFV